jgi:hypothetical protein
MPKIEPIEKTETKNYGDEKVVKFWLKRETKTSSLETNSARKKIISLFNSAKNSVICIQTEMLSDKEIIKAIFDAQDRDNRTYIMTNEDNSAMKELCDSCLIRYGVKNIGSFILLNPNTNSSQAVLYTDSFSESGLTTNENLLFDLDPEQCSILYWHFCYHFWNSTSKEIIEGKENDSGDAPIDVFPPMNNFCDSEYVKKELLSLSEGTNIITTSINNNIYVNLTHLKNTTLITSLSGNNNGLIPSIKSAENDVFACEKGISVNIIDGGERGVWVIPKNVIVPDDIFYALKANKEQILQIKDLFDKYKNRANYEFFNSDIRKNLSGKVILPLEGKAVIEIKKIVNTNLGNNNTGKELLPYSELKSSEPQFIDSGDSIETQYTWSNIPFYLPQNSKKHGLYADWENEKQKIISTLDSILNKINDAVKKKASISQRLFRFFLGKETVFNDQKNEIETLKTESEQFPFLEKEDFSEKIRKIDKIQKELSEHVADIDEEDRKSRIDEKIDQLKIDIEKSKEKLQLKNEELSNKEIDKQKRIEDLKKANEEINLNKIEGELFISKTKTEKDAIDKEIKRLEDEISRKEKEKNNPPVAFAKRTSNLDVFNPKNNNSNAGEMKNFTTKPPLPKTGTLYQAEGKAYLAINDWDEFEPAKKEAERLNAILCAERRNNG